MAKTKTQTQMPSEENPKAPNQAEDLELIANYITLKYSARFNAIRLTPEIYMDKEQCFQEVDDYTFNSLLIELKKEGFKVSDQKLRLVMFSDLVEKVDPILTFYQELPKWDGRNHIRSLADTVQIANCEELPETQDFWHLMFERFFVSMVATAISKNPGQICLVLTGGQGLGKSTWLSNLCPKSLQQDFLFVGGMPPRITDKQTVDLLAEKMIINLDDQLDSYNWKDFEQLKSIITSFLLTSRKPYARNDSTRRRRATLVASTNNPSILTDTHNRRYLVFEVEHINWETSSAVDIRQVYAQALALFKNGYRYRINTEEQETLNRLNARFRNVPLEEELVLKYLQVPKSEDEEIEWLSNTEIKMAIEQYSGQRNLYPNNLGKALKAHGFTRKSIRENGANPVYKWAVKTQWPSSPAPI